jgi:hypothetical protein
MVPKNKREGPAARGQATTRSELEQEMLRGSTALLGSDLDPALREVLLSSLGALNYAFILDNWEEQTGPVSVVAVGGDHVAAIATVEIPRDPASPYPEIEVQTFEEYEASNKPSPAGIAGRRFFTARRMISAIGTDAAP